MKKIKGFTLIELLVVIAIIGILSAVVLTALSSSKVKGRISGAQKTMKSVQSAAIFCMSEGVVINAPAPSQNGGGGAICSGSSSLYSKLPTGWSYSATVSNVVGNSFSFSASGDSKTITCTEQKCRVS